MRFEMQNVECRMQNEYKPQRRMRRYLAFIILHSSFCVLPASLRAETPAVLPYGMAGVPSSPVQRINTTPPAAIDLLGLRVTGDYLPQRVQTQTELGECELPAGAKFIRQGMADADPQVRTAAAAAAGKVHDPSLLPDLKKLMADTDPRVRRQAVLSGAAIAAGDSAFVDAGLADADASVVAAAVSVAGADRYDKIAKAIPAYPQPTRIVALRTLARTGHDRYAAAAVSCLQGEISLRAAAVEALGQMKAKSASDSIVKLLADEHPTVRRQALQALPNLLSEPDAQARYIAALADAENSVREAAARLLQQFPTADAITPLVATLPTESARLNMAARDALVAAGPPAAVAIEKLLTDQNPRRREDASYVLGKLKSDVGLDQHIKLMSDPDWAVVKQAAMSLGAIGRKEAIPAVVAVANRVTLPEGGSVTDFAASAPAVEQAIVAAGTLGDTSILPMCHKILPEVKTVAAEFRAAAAYAIGRSQEPSERANAGSLAGRLRDDKEGYLVQFECVKALGHLRAPAGKAVVGADDDHSKFSSNAQSHWLCHWVRDRISGEETPLPPYKENWQAQPSVMPLGY